MQRTIALLFLLFLIVSCDYNYQRSDATTADTVKPPSVYYSVGEVTINDLPTKIGQQIKDGDIIKTGDKAILETRFGKQSGFRVRENSELVYNEGERILLDVKQGTVMSIIEKNRPYSVRTPSAVAAVRGTIFFVDVLSPDSTYSCACNGTIEVQDHNNQLLKQLSSAHHHPAICEGDDYNMIDAGMQAHSDLEIFDFMYRLDNAVKE